MKLGIEENQMEEEVIHQPNMNDKPLFSGLDLVGVADLLKKSVPFKVSRENSSEVSSINRIPGVIAKSENQRVQTIFGGLHLEETFNNLSAMNKFSRTRNVVTVGQYLDDWVVDNYPDPKTATGRTRAGYEGYLRDYIKPQLGDIPLMELTPQKTRRFINWLKKEARSLKTKSPLSQTTQAHVCACLSKAMNDAVRDELIDRNPLVVKISLPRHSDIPSPYNKKELNTLLIAKDIPDYSLIVTIALTGARPGELLANRWGDYDFETGTLTIQHSLENHSHTIKDTKTHQERFVPLVELNRVALLEHYNNSKFNKPDDFIWPNKSGGSLDESLVNRRFTQSIRKLGLRKIRLYDLRHGHITELLNDGVPDKQIQERVGHSSATMTKDRYGHFLIGAQEKSIRKWESTRFKKTAGLEAGASDRIRTYDPRFTKPPLYH